jgi:hypothetical protein
MKTTRQSRKDRRVTLVALEEFLSTKEGGSLLVSDLIGSYVDTDLSDIVMGALRDELKTFRDAADFALRKLRNV